MTTATASAPKTPKSKTAAKPVAPKTGFNKELQPSPSLRSSLAKSR